jgi:hypothetical protein
VGGDRVFDSHGSILNNRLHSFFFNLPTPLWCPKRLCLTPHTYGKQTVYIYPELNLPCPIKKILDLYCYSVSLRCSRNALQSDAADVCKYHLHCTTLVSIPQAKFIDFEKAWFTKYQTLRYDGYLLKQASFYPMLLHQLWPTCYLPSWYTTDQAAWASARFTQSTSQPCTTIFVDCPIPAQQLVQILDTLIEPPRLAHPWTIYWLGWSFLRKGLH